MNAAEDLAAEAEAALRKARRYTDAAGGKPSVSGAGARKRQQASSYKQKCPGCGIFDHAYKDCFYRSHPYFIKDPSIEYAQSPVWIRYYNTFGGRYIKERDIDTTRSRACCAWSLRPRISEGVLAPGSAISTEKSVFASSADILGYQVDCISATIRPKDRAIDKLFFVFFSFDCSDPQPLA